MAIPTRQPLKLATIKSNENILSNEFIKIIKDELNVKSINWIKNNMKKPTKAKTVCPRCKQEAKFRMNKDMNIIEIVCIHCGFNKVIED